MLWRLGFAGPWNFLTQKQAACLWGQSCESLGWCHIARLSTRLSPSQWRDQLPAASVQRHPWDIFQDSPGGRWCYNVSWSPIVFCLVSRIFKIPDEASIDHAFYDLAYAAGQCNRSIGGLAWSLFDLGIRITFAALHWWLACHTCVNRSAQSQSWHPFEMIHSGSHPTAPQHSVAWYQRDRENSGNVTSAKFSARRTQSGGILVWPLMSFAWCLRGR